MHGPLNVKVQFIVTNVRNPALEYLETLTHSTWFSDTTFLRITLNSPGSYVTIHTASHRRRLRNFTLHKFLCARKF